MPIPDRVARFNRVVTNRITRPFAAHLPGFAVVCHRGRTTGRAYETPINVFRSDGGFVAALMYGKDRDWVRNVIAAGRCELCVRGHRIAVGHPEIVHDPQRASLPRGVREVVGLAGVEDVLRLERI